MTSPGEPGPPAAVVQDNLVARTYLWPGMGPAGGHSGMGIVSRGHDTTIAHNRVFDSGYAGIFFGGDGTHTTNNLVQRFCATIDDAGGLYADVGKTYRTWSAGEVTARTCCRGACARRAAAA